MANVVYGLCAGTSLICAVLLLRGYSRNGVRLLLWSGLCFVGFFVNNALLLVDVRIMAEDLSVWRTMPSLIGTGLLVYGLIWETRP